LQQQPSDHHWRKDQWHVQKVLQYGKD